MILLAACAAPSPQVSAVGGDPTRIEVRSTSPSVTVVVAGADAPMAGTSEPDGDAWVFRPTAPLARGSTYTIAAGDQVIRWVVPALDLPPFTVALHPTADALPRNAIKIYLHFSAAIRVPEHVSSVVHLIDDGGTVVTDAFVDRAIVDAERRWLAVLFHPGRQKTGIGFGAGVGPVLEEGRRYTVVVSGAISDGAGRPLGADVSRAFTIGPEDRVSPDPERWTVERAGDGLVLHLDEPVDAVLAPRAFQLDDHPAHAALGPGGRTLVFEGVPAVPFTLALVQPIEDLAANAPGRPFEARREDRGPAPAWSVRVLRSSALPPL